MYVTELYLFQKFYYPTFFFGRLRLMRTAGREMAYRVNHYDNTHSSLVSSLKGLHSRPT